VTKSTDMMYQSIDSVDDACTHGPVVCSSAPRVSRGSNKTRNEHTARKLVSANKDTGEGEPPRRKLKNEPRGDDWVVIAAQSL
jgi:hypothetical protein